MDAIGERTVRRPTNRDVPVLINNRNRVTTLRLLIAWLERRGCERIYVIDNASTYPPLLEYYGSLRHDVCMLRQNAGYLALWATELYREFCGAHFIYTDSDVVPEESCPNDFIERLLDCLDRFPQLEKVGFGLRIDDIPDTNPAKREILARESLFWKWPVAPGLYDADIDTTFALYRPFARGGYWAKAYRTGKPYIARHLPWYVDAGNLGEEEAYYRAHSTSDSYWSHTRWNVAAP